MTLAIELLLSALYDTSYRAAIVCPVRYPLLSCYCLPRAVPAIELLLYALYGTRNRAALVSALYGTRYRAAIVCPIRHPP